jgi:hypothetical protein
MIPTTLFEHVGKKLLGLGASGKAVMRFAATLEPEDRATYLTEAMEHFKRWLSFGVEWRSPPVDIRCFVESAEFLNQKDVIYPENMKELIAMNSGEYVEIVLTGGIGMGKSTLAEYSQAYQLYILSCIHNAQRLFRIAQSSEIMIVFQSLTSTVAKTVGYARFKALIDSAPYFQEVFQYDKTIESEMHFPSRIIVKHLSGSPMAAIGQNILGGIIDEVNFFQRIEQSKQAADGGVFDQIMEVYNSIVRRRKSRFMIRGRLFGVLCLASSKRYPGEFTDQKAEEARRQFATHGKTDIYIYDRKIWDVKPEGTYCGERFNVFCGDAAHKPRLLEEGEEIEGELRHLVVAVPVEFRNDFERDIMSAIRDIAGMATLALHPFILDTEAVSSAFSSGRKSVLSRDDCDFVKTIVQIFPGRFTDLAQPRFAHIDLALTGDSAGVAVGHVDKFIEMQRGGWSETLPRLVYDCVLEVPPPQHGEISFAKIRHLLYKLRELGLPLKWVSFDSYNSRDSIQILAGQGFKAGLQSMDTDTMAYDVFKTALYDRRVDCHACAKAQREIIRLERNPKTGKVDHPMDSSKDLSDAMAGVAYGLTMRREIWLKHKVPITKIPGYLVKGQQVKEKDDAKVLAA